MTEHLRREQDELTAANATHQHTKLQKLSKAYANLYCEVTELKVANEELARRLFALEEKELQRARDEHQKEQFLDWKNSEGLDTEGC